MRILFADATVLSGEPLTARPGHVLVENGHVVEVSDRPIASAVDRTIALRGRTLMPGLIDCHVHVVSSILAVSENAALPDPIALLRSLPILRGMLMRGFTTVRDVGGCPPSLALAQAQGLLEGPRIVACGKSLSQTGGHGDARIRGDARDPGRFTHAFGALSRIADGVEAVRQAAREELHAGAAFLKVHANGGVASPTDPIHALGYSEAELRAIVEEARNRGTYVAAHLYTDASIERAVECGVHSLEHCNLITDATAQRAAEAGCFAVPTLVVFEQLALGHLNLPAEARAKLAEVGGAGLASLERLMRAGVPLAYGTDLLGELHPAQSEEFLIRREVQPAAAVLASATIVAARLIDMEGRLGVVEPGAIADLLVVDGDPLTDLGLLTGQGRHLPLIVQGGRIVKEHWG